MLLPLLLSMEFGINLYLITEPLTIHTKHNLNLSLQVFSKVSIVSAIIAYIVIHNNFWHCWGISGQPLLGFSAGLDVDMDVDVLNRGRLLDFRSRCHSPISWWSCSGAPPPVQASPDPSARAFAFYSISFWFHSSRAGKWHQSPGQWKPTGWSLRKER